MTPGDGESRQAGVGGLSRDQWAATVDIALPSRGWPVGLATMAEPYIEVVSDATGLAFVLEAGIEPAVSKSLRSPGPNGRRFCRRDIARGAYACESRSRMDELETQITAFLDAKRIAVVGLSSHEGDFSCAVLDKLAQTGAEVYGVNPRLEEDRKARRYRTLQAIPVPIDAVFIATAPAVTEQVVQTCHELGIGRVWMHQGVGQGSTSQEAIAYCKKHGIAVIDRGCPMMFVQPVDWFHRMFRWCKGMHAVPQPDRNGPDPTAGS